MGGERGVNDTIAPQPTAVVVIDFFVQYHAVPPTFRHQIRLTTQPPQLMQFGSYSAVVENLLKFKQLGFDIAFKPTPLNSAFGVVSNEQTYLRRSHREYRGAEQTLNKNRNRKQEMREQTLQNSKIRTHT